MAGSIRWGIIGCGKIARAFARGLRSVKDAELTAVASRTPGRAEEFARTYGAKRFYVNYEGIVQDDGVDVIYVATTHDKHYQNSLLAIENGKHVLCEKPFTVNAVQAEKLIAAARSRNLFLMEAMWTRFLPATVRLGELLDSGLIGDVRLLRADFGLHFPWDPDNRLHNRDLAGGALLDLGIYPVSFSFFIFKKAPEQIESSALLGKSRVDEFSSYYFRYGGGRAALLSSSFKFLMPHQAMVAGSEGYLLIPDFFHPKQFTVQLNNGKRKKIRLPYRSTGLNYQALEVVECIRNGEVECRKMPLDESLEIMRTMDRMRADWQLKYPNESV